MEISFLEKTQRSGTSIKTAEGSLDNKNTSHSFIQDTLKYWKEQNPTYTNGDFETQRKVHIWEEGKYKAFKSWFTAGPQEIQILAKEPSPTYLCKENGKKETRHIR